MTHWKTTISGGTVSTDPRVLRGVCLAMMTVCLCLLPRHSHSSQELLLDPDRQFQFAEQYFRKGDYYRAIGEYERFIYFFPEAEEVELARYKIGLAYLKGERYEEAIGAFEQFIEELPQSTYTAKSYLGISESCVSLKRYNEAMINLQNLITIAPDQEVRDEAHYRCGWVCLSQGLWEEGQAYFNKISPQNRQTYRLEELFRELDRRELLRRKDPTTAGVLAIVPGAGHLYCERYRDGLLSFLVNGALIFAAYEAFDHDQNALGGLITFFEAGLYSGNIYSAVGSAHKYNRLERDRFLNHLKEQARISLSFEAPEGDRALVISCRIAF